MTEKPIATEVSQVIVLFTFLVATGFNTAAWFWDLDPSPWPELRKGAGAAFVVALLVWVAFRVRDTRSARAQRHRITATSLDELDRGAGRQDRSRSRRRKSAGQELAATLVVAVLSPPVAVILLLTMRFKTRGQRLLIGLVSLPVLTVLAYLLFR